MKSQVVKWIVALAIGLFALIGATAWIGSPQLGSGEAMAVVGRPLTPISYAGVARRTVRRAAYY